MEIIGKSRLKSYFEALVKKKTYGQFYIFEGADGVGKRTFADYVASMIHCEGENPPCGECGACIKHRTHNHPDYIHIENDESDKEKKNITVETIRRYSEDMYIKPLLCDTKIYVLDDEKPLGNEGQNAFLKILEEPPQYAVIFLLVKNSASLLSTVISRGIMCHIDPCSFEETVSYVKKEFPQVQQRAELIASFSGGVLGRARSLALEDDFFSLRDDFYKVLARVSDGNAASVIDTAAFFMKNKERTEELLNLLVSWLRDIVCLKTAGEKRLINFDFSDRLFAFSSAVTAEKAMKTAEAAQKMAASYSKGNNLELWTLNVMKNLV